VQYLDLGQPELNDLDKLHKMAQKRRVPSLRFGAWRDELTSGSVMCRFVRPLENAREVVNAYKRAIDS